MLNVERLLTYRFLQVWSVGTRKTRQTFAHDRGGCIGSAESGRGVSHSCKLQPVRAESADSLTDSLGSEFRIKEHVCGAGLYQDLSIRALVIIDGVGVRDQNRRLPERRKLSQSRGAGSTNDQIGGGIHLLH